MIGRVALSMASVACALSVAAPALASEVSVGSPPDRTPQNHQNEPAVAIDANHPSFAVAGWNDFVDWARCPQADATQFGTCADPADDGVGLSAVAFSFDSGNTWIRPAYTGWTAADCDPTAACSAHEGTIHTLPWYYESGLVSDGDPSLAFGPRPGPDGTFSWANGSRLYYTNLTANFSAERSEQTFKGFEAIAVSRTDDPRAAAAGDASAWMDPVIISRQNAALFSDHEQVWADNAASSPFFGNAYSCYAAFRSQEVGGFPAPIVVARSTDGGDTWTQKQIGRASCRERV